MVDPAHTRLSLVRQCRFVSIARSSFYYGGTGESPLNLRLMRSIGAPSVDTSKAAINRHLKSGHFGHGG